MQTFLEGNRGARALVIPLRLDPLCTWPGLEGLSPHRQRCPSEESLHLFTVSFLCSGRGAPGHAITLGSLGALSNRRALLSKSKIFIDTSFFFFSPHGIFLKIFFLRLPLDQFPRTSTFFVVFIVVLLCLLLLLLLFCSSTSKPQILRSRLPVYPL